MEISQIRDNPQEKTVNRITKSDLVKLKILLLLENSHDKLSITEVSKKLGIKYETTRNSIAFLTSCGLLELSSEKHGSLVYEYVQLSNLGRKAVGVINHAILNRA